jgi:hypothetical protein
LPRGSIERAYIVGKIAVEEYPALAHLGAGREPELRAPAKLLRVNTKERRRLREG